MKEIITKILTAVLILLIMCSSTAFCSTVGTIRMKIDNSTPWTNINISESYDECLSLNSTTSTLGTSALEAHLTTDYDWSAMAVFSVSQYGTKTNNGPSNNSTTKNKSGIYDIGTTHTQTTGLLNSSTNTSNDYISGLYDKAGNLKKYVNKIDPTTGANQNGKICISFIKEGGTLGWLSSIIYKGTTKSQPVIIRNGLFGAYIGNGANQATTSGQGSANTTFRPVIWN